jgi:MFS family permease
MAGTPKKHNRLLLICILTIILSSALASGIQSSWGKVDVRGIKIPTQNGQWVVADLYKPKSATAETPAPLVVVVPGFQRSKETLSNVSIELSRRGIVVIAIDPYAQGGSSSSMSRRAATTEGYGMFALVDYAFETDNLNYVDKNRIGATGHSAGGNAAIRGASYFGKEAIAAGTASKLHSVFVSGYVLTLRENVLKHVRSNVGISYALYDEGAYRNALENGDMRRAPEALRLVNSGIGPTNSIDEVAIGQYYGEIPSRTLRIVHNEPLLHPFQPYSWEAMENQVAYFRKVFEMEDTLESDRQVWHWKELLTFISLLAAFVGIVPFARFLVDNIPYFNALRHPLPEPQPRPKGAGKVLFWGLFVLGALIACFSYIPMTELSKVLFQAASNREQTWFFPQRMNNGVMLWALFNGIIGFALFWLSYHFFGRKHGIHAGMWGTKITREELKRTLLLALIILSSFFIFLFVIYYFFHVDYRFIFSGVRVFQPVTLLLFLMYVPMFLPFFMANSLRVNGAMRLEGQPEWRSMLLGGIANSLGLFFIVMVQYVTFAFTGTVFWTDGWLYINLLFAVVPIMFILPFFHRYFFRLTGRIYLGPLTMCMIFIMILLSNTVCYTPL